MCLVLRLPGLLGLRSPCGALACPSEAGTSSLCLSCALCASGAPPCRCRQHVASRSGPSTRAANDVMRRRRTLPPMPYSHHLVSFSRFDFWKVTAQVQGVSQGGVPTCSRFLPAIKYRQLSYCSHCRVSCSVTRHACLSSLIFPKQTTSVKITQIYVNLTGNVRNLLLLLLLSI